MSEQGDREQCVCCKAKGVLVGEKCAGKKERQ
jgi:hypothetical protein